jgi:hypothetical protein
MKQKIILTIMLVLVVATTTQAQTSPTFVLKYSSANVTKFLGIPIDGTKQDMERKIMAKGFTKNPRLGCLEGEFNGEPVEISIVTDRGKVYRVMVMDSHSRSATDIRIRFNNLYGQFLRNSQKYEVIRYVQEEVSIPDDEDIVYGMNINHKRYEASFAQLPGLDSLQQKAMFSENLTDNQRQEIVSISKILMETTTEKERTGNVPQEKMDSLNNAFKTELGSKLLSTILQACNKKSVWFMISEDSYESAGYKSEAPYRIIMYYDNNWNKSDGEDL